jgi:lysophospholipase L1-like esterase
MNRSLFAGLAGLALISLAGAQTAARTLRWAVIGDNTASGYPARLGPKLLADSVVSFHSPGATALRSGDSSYWTSGKLAQVFAYQPDIVSIQLGGSDSKSANWSDSANFERDVKALIDTLKGMPSQPRILVVWPTPTWTTAPGARRNAVIGGGVIPRLRAAALAKGADTANLYAPFLARESLFPDSVNPSGNAANDSLAKYLWRAYVEQSIRVMCVGNSITYGNGTTTGVTAKDAYPVVLNKLLGKRYWVWNGGKSGWWMQRAQLPGASSNFKSYITDKAQMDTLFMLKPHFITVKLGTNDAREYFWNTARFSKDYRTFIDTLYDNLSPKPKIVLFKAFPAWRINGNWPFPNSGYTAAQSGINGDIIRDSLWPAIDAIANSRAAKVAGVIDLYAPFAGPTQNTALSTDGVHPNRAGLDSIARVVYRNFLPIAASVRAASNPASRAPARKALRASLRPAAAPARGSRTLDGKAASGRAAAGVLVEPSAKKAGAR